MKVKNKELVEILDAAAENLMPQEIVDVEDQIIELQKKLKELETKHKEILLKKHYIEAAARFISRAGKVYAKQEQLDVFAETMGPDKIFW